jgi:hypothetical protein
MGKGSFMAEKKTGKESPTKVEVTKIGEDEYQLTRENGKPASPKMSGAVLKAYLLDKIYGPKVDARIKKADEVFASKRGG